MNDSPTRESAPAHPHDSTWAEVTHSLIYSAVGAPVTSVGQMFDRDFEFLESFKPKQATPGSFDYYAQGVGSSIGMAIDVAGLRYGVGKAAAAAFGEGGVSNGFFSGPVGSMFTGGLYGGALTPLASTDRSQAKTRAINAVTNGLTYFTVTRADNWVDGKLNGIKNPLLHSLADVVPDAVIGMPIGALSTNFHSWLTDGHLAGWDATKRSMLDWGIIGGITGATESLGKHATTKIIEKPEPMPLAVYDRGTVANGGTEVESIYKRALPSVFQVVRREGRQVAAATGFAISRDRLATAYHVVAKADQLTAISVDGRQYRLTIDKVDPARDLAILRRLGPSWLSDSVYNILPKRGFVPLTFSNTKVDMTASVASFKGGENFVYGIGYGGHAPADNPRIAEGRIEIARKPDIANLPAHLHPDQKVFSSSSPLSQGFSGGPLIDAKGEVIGVNLATQESTLFGYPYSQALSMPVEKLQELIDRQGSPDYSSFLPLFPGSPHQPRGKDEQRQLKQVYSDLGPSILKMRGFSQTGDAQYATAFAIDDKGHFIAGKDLMSLSSLQLHQNENWSINLQPVASHKGIALFKSDAQPGETGVPPVKMGNSAELFGPGTLMALGYPKEMTDLNATIGAPAIKSQQRFWFDSGFGGAPIVNKSGKLVGVIQADNLHIGTDDVQQLLDFGYGLESNQARPS